MKRTLVAVVGLSLALTTLACSKKTGPATPEAAATKTAEPANAAAVTPTPTDAGATNVSPPTTPPSTVPNAAGLTVQQIASALSKTVCERMIACDQNAGVSAADCATGMAADLTQALPDKAKQVDKAGLDGCIAAIGKATCEELNSPNPPKGCEFIE